jgi:REP-associated tyrosine transposase
MKERKQIRLKGYDYSKSGYYFVTICTQNRQEWFGKVKGGITHLNKCGEFAKNFWAEIPGHFEAVEIDEFSIMPNHAHGILIIGRNMAGDAYMRPIKGMHLCIPYRIKQKCCCPR